MQIGGDGQPLVKRANDRHEDRRDVQPSMGAHFGQVLVRQGQRIGARCVDALRTTVGLDHLFAAARIAGDRMRRNLRSGRQQAACNQRPERQNEGGSMATGIGDALAGANPLALRAIEFRQAVDPARMDAMRRRGVDDAGRRVFGQRHRFPRRIVGQAEEGDIGGVDQPLALGRVLAFVRVDAQHLDIVALREVFVDL